MTMLTKSISKIIRADEYKNNNIESILHHGPIVGLKYLNGLIIASSNDQLKIFDNEERLRFVSEKLLNSQRIFGIEEVSIEKDGYLILITGGKFMRLVYLNVNEDSGISITLKSEIIVLKDWLLTIKINSYNNNELDLFLSFSNGFIAKLILTLNQQLEFETISDYGSVLIPKKCLLYSSLFLNNTIAASGTIFNEIIIWDYNNTNINNTTTINGKLVKCLKGHEGVIFGLDFLENKNLLASTSDDRTIRIWDLNQKNENESLKFTIFAHQSRVWKVKFINSKKILSIGEDSSCKLIHLDWDKNEYHIIHSFENHLGKNLWNFQISNDYKYLFTAGNDGALIKWELMDWLNEAPLKLNIELEKQQNDSIWSFILLNEELSVITTKKGIVYLYNIKNEQIKHIKLLKDDELIGYSLISFIYNEIKKQYLISIASKIGSVFFILLNQIDLSFEVTKLQLHNSRIEKGYLKYNNDNQHFYYLTKQVDQNQIFINQFQVNENTIINQNTTLKLDIEHYNITSFYIQQENDDINILLGTRNGKLIYYKNEKLKEIQEDLHNKETVSDILYYKNNYYCCGRDGSFTQFIINEKEEIELLKNIKLTKGWIEKMSVYNNEFYFITFYQKKIQIIEYDSYNILFSYNCGGAHRLWSIHINCKLQLMLSYIEKGKMSFIKNIQNNFNKKLLPSIHGREIRCLELIKENLFVTSGEDGIINLIQLNNNNNNNNNNQLNNNNNQLSYKLIDFNNKTMGLITKLIYLNNYLFSIGANQTLYVWKIINNQIISFVSEAEKIGDIQEVRIMEIKGYTIDDNNILLLIGYSNGYLRLFKFNNEDLKVEFLFEIQLNPIKCILSMEFITEFKYDNEFNLFYIIGDSSGRIHIIQVNKNQIHLVNNQIIHQSGINSIKIIQHNNNNNNNNQYSIVSGGDDTNLIINKIQLNFINNEINVNWLNQLICDYKNVSAIQDIIIMSNNNNNNNKIYSVSSDSRLIEYNYNYNELRFNYNSSFIIDLFDPSAILLNQSNQLIISGFGIQVLKL
ncbi:WD40 repeat-like protein [Neoconidiobolus thromboides FSU 785]|nr:WD40 repeat-like protein [Neoconidiobolus thromboides FSU 785]